MREVGLEYDGSYRPWDLEAVCQDVWRDADALELFEARCVERLAERSSLLGRQIGAGPKRAWSEVASAEQALSRLR
jgi:hypothetical protein